MFNPAVSGVSLFLLTSKRVLAYIRHHGVLRGGSQLFGIFRQLHELRLGDFKGRDAQGNEFYEDRYAILEHKRRFVIYANSQPHTQPPAAVHSPNSLLLAPLTARGSLATASMLTHIFCFGSGVV